MFSPLHNCAARPEIQHGEVDVAALKNREVPDALTPGVRTSGVTSVVATDHDVDLVASLERGHDLCGNPTESGCLRRSRRSVAPFSPA